MNYVFEMLALHIREDDGIQSARNLSPIPRQQSYWQNVSDVTILKLWSLFEALQLPEDLGSKS